MRRDGHCSSDEVCINGGSLAEGGFEDHVGLKYAYCVKRIAFYSVSAKSPLGLKLNKQNLVNDLEGKRLSMIVSKKDMSTPLEMDTLNVEVEGAGSGSGEAGGIDKCRDCMDLETEQFRKGTDSLKAQARMLTTGAVAGVLWLALMSG